MLRPIVALLHDSYVQKRRSDALRHRSNSVATVAQSWPMARSDRPARPLDAAALDRLALRYVERFATTRAKLAQYLNRKIRERGWEGESADPVALAERFAALGYIDDRAFGEARARSLTRRGLGSRRVAMALHQAGIAGEDREEILPEVAEQAVDTALRFAQRRRFGPFGAVEVDRPVQEKQVGAMVRAGHSPELARRIVRLVPGSDTAFLFET